MIRLLFIVKPPKELQIVAEPVVVLAYSLLLRVYGYRFAKAVEVAQNILLVVSSNGLSLRYFDSQSRVLTLLSAVDSLILYSVCSARI
jgi:hypothetical protein